MTVVRRLSQETPDKVAEADKDGDRDPERRKKQKDNPQGK
jgi:hypothetical protein